jgi:hypothetical protein
VIEWIKGLDGVRDVIWTEPVELVGKKDGRPDVADLFKQV